MVSCFFFFLENRQKIGFLVNTTKCRTRSLIRCTWKGTKAKYWLVLLLYIIQKSAYLAGLWWHIVKQTVKYQFKFKSIFATKFLEGAAYSTVFWKRLIRKSVYLFNVTFLNVRLIHHLQWKTLVFKLASDPNKCCNTFDLNNNLLEYDCENRFEWCLQYILVHTV